MKKIFYLAIAALAFAACARELAPETESNLPKVKVSIKAILEQEDVTKAEINMSNGTASWEAGDQIAVHTKNGKLATLEAESAGTSVTFSGTVDAGDDIEDGAIAYYPASIAIEGDDAKVNMPASYASAAAAAKGFPMRGVLTGDAVEFKHIGGLMKVSVNDVPSEVTSLVFTAASVAVSGELDVDATAPKCVVGSASSSITITSAAADRAAGTAVFYIPLPTGVLTGGFSLALKNGSNDVYVKTSTNALEITRAKLFKMKAFAPEGAASGWALIGSFNSWSFSDLTVMTEVPDHANWVVARNIGISDTKGVKIIESTATGWTEQNNYGFGQVQALHTQYDAVMNGANITFGAYGAYDIYFNTDTKKIFLAEVNEPWYYRSVYLMTDMVLTDQTYYLYLWPHGSSSTNLKEWPGFEGTTETISGIKYYRFDIAINDGPCSGTYDCIFHSDGDAVRYDFRDGKLVFDDTSSNYYASFTGTSYNAGEEDYTYGEDKTNPMTIFTDPSKPQGKSGWNLLVYPDHTSYDVSSYKAMEWDNGAILVYKNIVIGPSTGFAFRFTNGHNNTFYYQDGGVASNVEFNVSFDLNKDRKSVPMTTVSDITSDTYCDVYLDIINNKAKVVPCNMVSLYFGLTDREVSHAYLHTWGAFSTTFPGMEMTVDETINGIKYYKASVPASSLSDLKFLVDDGDHSGHWQTGDFTTADFSGGKSAYYFNVAGTTITQLSGKPEPISITINGVFSDWDSIPGNDKRDDYGKNTSTMKAYSDGTHLFVYLKVVTDADGTHDAENSNSEVKLFFDKNNNSSDGSTDWYRKGADDFDNVYRVKFASNGALRDVLADASYNAEVNVQDDASTKTTEMELKFDIAALNYNKTVDLAKQIKIFCLGYCTSEFAGECSVVIPD